MRVCVCVRLQSTTVMMYMCHATHVVTRSLIQLTHSLCAMFCTVTHNSLLHTLACTLYASPHTATYVRCWTYVMVSYQLIAVTTMGMIGGASVGFKLAYEWRVAAEVGLCGCCTDVHMCVCVCVCVSLQFLLQLQ